MSKDAISDYSATANSNTDVGGVNINEGCAPSTINNAIREVMSHLADLNAGSSSLGTIKVDNLQLDANAITSTNTNGDIAITPNGTGDVVIDGLKHPQADGSAGQFLKTDGSGQLAFATVDTSIADNAVTLAKMASGTDGNIISYDASGNPVAVATGTAGQILTSAGAGAPPTFADAAGGGLKLLESIDSETSFTWSKNSSATLIRAVFGGASGGGAGSGNGNFSAASGGGGAGGIWFEIAPSDVTANVAVTIGAAAAATGTVASGGNGSAGGTSSFGSYITINGGGGGNFVAANSAPVATVGGAGGTVSTNFSAGGNVNYLVSTTGGTGGFQNDSNNSGEVNATAGNLVAAGFKGKGGGAYKTNGGYYGNFAGGNAAATGGTMLFSSTNLNINAGASANNGGDASSTGRIIIEQYGAI